LRVWRTDSPIQLDLLQQPDHFGVSPLDNPSTFDNQFDTLCKYPCEDVESICCTLKGSGVSFTGSTTTGGVGGDGAAQPSKLTSISTAAIFKGSDFFSIGVLQGLLGLGVSSGQGCHLLRVLTSGLLTRYSLIACGLTGFRQIGFERGDAVLLHAQHRDDGRCCDQPPVHATPPPTRS